MERWIKEYGPHLYFFLYLILCISTATERILYTDSAYYLFNIVNDGSFYIPHNRYLALFAQILPLAAVRLELPLGLVIKLYAVNIGLFPYVGYLIVRYGFGKPFFALSFLLMSSVFIHHSFFSPIAELVLGLNISLVWIGWMIVAMERKQLDPMFMAFSLFVLAVLFISHPVALASAVIATFLIAFYKRSKPGACLSLLVLAVLIIKTMTFNSYEQDKWGVFDITWATIPEMMQSYAAVFIGVELISVLLPASIFYVLVIRMLWKQHHRLESGIVLLLLPAFILFAILLNFRYETFYAYVEGYLAPCFFILVSIGLYSFMHSSMKNRYEGKAISLILMLSLISLGRLAYEPAYRYQKQFLSEVIREANEDGCSKIILDSGDHQLHPHILTKWSVPYETLLYTALKEESASTVFYEILEPGEANPNRPDIMLGANWQRETPYHQLNPDYFHLPEGPYCRIHRSSY